MNDSDDYCQFILFWVILYYGNTCTGTFFSGITSNALNNSISQYVTTSCWLFFSTFIGMAYMCNLRANIVSVDLEKPMDTLQVICSMVLLA